MFGWLADSPCNNSFSFFMFRFLSWLVMDDGRQTYVDYLENWLEFQHSQGPITISRTSVHSKNGTEMCENNFGLFFCSLNK